MPEIVLKPELIKGLQKVLVDYEPENEDPILAAQYLSAVVGSIVATSDDSKITYYLRRDFISTGSGGAGSITFAAQLPFGTQRFVSFSESNFLITVLDAGDAPDVAAGDVVYITSD